VRKRPACPGSMCDFGDPLDGLAEEPIWLLAAWECSLSLTLFPRWRKGVREADGRPSGHLEIPGTQVSQQHVVM
jgi:hypothetical protein